MSSPSAPLRLDLPGQILRRAVGVVALGVLALLGLGLLGMRDDVADELDGAKAVAVLVERLSTLSLLDDAQAARALQQWAAESELRHLNLRVLDAQGGLILKAGPTAEAADATRPNTVASLWPGLQAHLFKADDPFTVAWALARPQGQPWSVVLGAAPESEQHEALQSLLQASGVLILMALALLALMAWNTRRALAPLSRLLAAIQGLEHAQPGQRHFEVQALPPMPIAELEALAAALRHLDAALAQADAERRRLAQQVLGLQEEERAHLARELHDEFGQRLTALRLDTRWLLRQTTQAPELQAVVQQMDQHCAAIQQDIGSVLAQLRPLAVSDEACTVATLQTLLQSLVTAWRRSAGAGFALSVELDLGDHAQEPLPRDLILMIYRISQEALTNAAKHAQAQVVRLSLQWQQVPSQAARLVWAVQDDGRGEPQPEHALQRGHGLAGLKERLWAWGADLEIGPAHTGSPRPGLRLAAAVPVPA
ncbi:sensor histidine kinase [Ideonella sp.]|jgi:two-component system sensor histidine kinase UhpB|uniref:sensor histidine kinase n=1 Tax=Ideonella sp. TaxID=1929293 RepID=UPI0037BF31B4